MSIAKHIEIGRN